MSPYLTLSLPPSLPHFSLIVNQSFSLPFARALSLLFSLLPTLSDTLTLILTLPLTLTFAFPLTHTFTLTLTFTHPLTLAHPLTLTHIAMAGVASCSISQG